MLRYNLNQIRQIEQTDMDTVSVQATEAQGDRFNISWRWHQNNTPAPTGGSFFVRVSGVAKEEAGALAELRALYYLLEERQVHGANRLGSGVTIEQSYGAVRKALTKGSLKTLGVGRTHKTSVATASEFLATKYFAAVVVVRQKAKQFEFKKFEKSDLEVFQDFPRAKLQCELLGEQVAITRHALLRQVGRIDQQIVSAQDENNLSSVPDERFEAAWQWFKRVLSNPNVRLLNVRPDLLGKSPEKYADARYLFFPDSQVPAVMAVTRDSSGLVLSTVLRKDQATFIEWPAYVVGQKLVPAHMHERSRRMRGL